MWGGERRTAWKRLRCPAHGRPLARLAPAQFGTALGPSPAPGPPGPRVEPDRADADTLAARDLHAPPPARPRLPSWVPMHEVRGDGLPSGLGRHPRRARDRDPGDRARDRGDPVGRDRRDVVVPVLTAGRPLPAAAAPDGRVRRGSAAL